MNGSYKTICLIIILFGLGSTQKSFAQESRFGLHLTPNLFWFGSENDKSDVSAGFRVNWGLIADFYFSERYAIHSGVSIGQRASSLKLNDTTGSFRQSVLDIPIALKMQSADMGNYRLFAKFGSILSFNTGEKVNFRPEFNEARLLEDYFLDFQLNFLVGIGLTYDIGGGSEALIGLDYQGGITNALSSQHPHINKRDNFRMNGINLSLGFLF